MHHTRSFSRFMGAALAAVGLLAPAAYADRRGYVWTYEYLTMPAGQTEVEVYSTATVPDTDDSAANTWDHEVELEYGLTDHWDLALYQRWRQKNDGDDSAFQYRGFKARTRYRFAERGQWPLDLLAYLEYIQDDDLAAGVGEAKLIVAKDVGPLNLSYNQIAERALESGHETEHAYAAGVNYELPADMKLGVESKGNYTEDKYALGPTLALAAEHNRFWVALGALWGLNDNTDDINVRLLVGVPF